VRPVDRTFFILCFFSYCGLRDMGSHDHNTYLYSCDNQNVLYSSAVYMHDLFAWVSPWLIWVPSNSGVSNSTHMKMIRSSNTMVTVSHVKCDVVKRDWIKVSCFGNMLLNVQGWLFGDMEWADSCWLLVVSRKGVSKQTSEQ